MRPRVELSGVTIRSPSGRSLFEGLDLELGREHVALIGRNGVGKSTLLAVVAGTAEASIGRVRTSSRPRYIPQILSEGGSTAPLSKGELRRAALADAATSGADILLLDEPTEDLDAPSVAWLRGWLPRWEGCLIVATHDRCLLEDFRHFFIASEAGCRYLSGTLADVDAELEREHRETERRYARSLGRLEAKEARTERVAQRRGRKKRRGRCRELDRATPRIRLNGKRGAAQVYQGKFAKIRQSRLDAIRTSTKAMRRALTVELSTELFVPSLPEHAERDVLTVHAAAVHAQGRCLFDAIDLALGRGRIAVVGPNGSGKTTLLEVLMDRRPPDSGTVRADHTRIGSIAQGASDWMLDESLLGILGAGEVTAESLSGLLVRHRFPLALAERPLRSLSPGERARAALIALFQRSPAPELLVLDEPTFSLDLVGQRALTRAISAWPGGLVVASHDRAFLSAIGIDRWIQLGSRWEIDRTAARREP